MEATIKSKTGKNKTTWQAINEAEDEDILHAMEAIESIGIFLECRAEHELYEYQQALQGWQSLNNMFNHEGRKRIKQYADKIESE